jgi:hypothetical protein
MKWTVLALSLLLTTLLAITLTGCPAGWKADDVITEGEYDYVKTFDNYELYWETDADYIYIGIKANTTGWVAIGFNPTSKMENADIILGFVANGELFIYDLFSLGERGPHMLDTELGGVTNITEASGQEIEGITIVEFKKQRITDDDNDHDLTTGVHTIIWAFGSEDDRESYHSKRGSSSITID